MKMIQKIKNKYQKFKDKPKEEKKNFFVKVGLLFLIICSTYLALTVGEIKNQNIDTLRENNLDLILSNITIQNTSAILFVCDEMKKFQQDGYTLAEDKSHLAILPTTEEVTENAIKTIVEALQGFNKEGAEYVLFTAKNQFLEDLLYKK
jgi:hypothetical protein